MSAASAYQLRPLTALRALRALLRDPDDTRQVFIIIAALSGRSRQRVLRRLKRTSVGARLMREQRALAPRLADRAALARLPSGSLGGHYLAFCERAGITAEGLIAAAQQAQGFERFTYEERLVHERLRDSHDLWHVVTGYQTDLIGEACVLAFSVAQTRNPGIGLIVLMALLESRGERAFARRLIVEAFARGLRAEWLPATDWETLLERPLDDVREQLRIGPPPAYDPVWSRDPHGGVAVRMD